MKLGKVFIVLLFVVLFTTGMYSLDGIMPEDEAGLTASYSEEVSIFVPPSVSIVEKFDTGKAELATVTMPIYRQLSASSTSNFMLTSIEGGGA